MKTKNNRRADIGATITWIVALFLIVIALIFYSAVTVGERVKFGQTQYSLVVGSSNNANLLLTMSLLSSIENNGLERTNWVEKLCKAKIETGLPLSYQISTNDVQTSEVIYIKNEEVKKAILRGEKCE